MSERDEALYLIDMWEAVQSIEEYIGEMSFEELMKDEKTYDAAMRQFTILGEAANRISDKIKKKYTKIPWPKIVGLRNRLMHEYSNIANDVVWDTYTHDVPELKQQLKKLLDEEGIKTS